MTDRYSLRVPLRVRWAEADAQGIVFNGHYLTYFDVAVTEYWRTIGLPYPQGLEGTGVDVFAVKSTVEYKAPAHFDDELTICVRIARLGNSSMTFELAIERDANIITRGELIYACADPLKHCAVNIPDLLRSAITQFEAQAAA
jgi:acyl-CoA thioester hydrolase